MPKEHAHLIVAKDPEGKVNSYPMKQWLRDHPEHLPEGLDATNDTSHTLRRRLRQNGWTMREVGWNVFLIKPENEDLSYADPYIQQTTDESSESEESSFEEILEAEEITFGLERDLQMAIRANINQLEEGLKITDSGKEKITEAGRIDILASDSKEVNVIIELKAGEAKPDSIAQILAYMGSVAGSEGKSVRGILVAGDFHKRVILASKAIPNLSLKKYSFQFNFKDI